MNMVIQAYIQAYNLDMGPITELRTDAQRTDAQARTNTHH